MGRGGEAQASEKFHRKNFLETQLMNQALSSEEKTLHGSHSLQDRVVLVTGAGSGLGEAAARAFSRAGCAVACIDINADAAERVAKSIGNDDVESSAWQC